VLARLLLVTQLAVKACQAAGVYKHCKLQICLQRHFCGSWHADVSKLEHALLQESDDVVIFATAQTASSHAPWFAQQHVHIEPP
jgi:hypothetical protein